MSLLTNKRKKPAPEQHGLSSLEIALAVSALSAVLAVVLIGLNGLANEGYFSRVILAQYLLLSSSVPKAVRIVQAPFPRLNIPAYDAKLLELAHINIGTSSQSSSPAILASLFSASASSSSLHASTSAKTLWPVNTVAPIGGGVIPFRRIVGYYGNPLSTQMGILGQYAPDVVLKKLTDTVAQWQVADPTTPVIPALDYIAVVAQGSAGPDGKYRLRMSDANIDSILTMAQQVNAIVFLDVQPGLSDVETEVPLLERYLKMPQVYLALDPEFAMKTSGRKPGSVIGTLDASDINFAAQYLASLVKKYNLPPKILLVHRFTLNMVTNYQNIMPLPEVQMVMAMDGWGPQDNKLGTYNEVVYHEPVQFAGFKLFYKNDVKVPGDTMMTPAQVLSLTPQPVVITYQ